MIPEKFRLLIYLNPMSFFILSYRSILFKVSLPEIYVIFALVLWSVVSILVGFFIFNKLEVKLIKRV
jgi:ABC-type polysaccharide/polyol phosphate export permease